MIDIFGGRSSNAGVTPELQEKWLDKIFAAAQPGAVFSDPVVSGEYTVITASEVSAGGGFGFGSGSGPASQEGSANGTAAPVSAGGGGGGGGGSSGRPVAAIVIGPHGVKIKPIVDPSKIALAAVSAWLSIAVLLVRRQRARKV